MVKVTGEVLVTRINEVATFIPWKPVNNGLVERAHGLSVTFEIKV